MHALGIDIGGTNTKFGITDDQGSIVFQSRIKTKEFPQYPDLIKRLYEEVSKETDVGKLAGIGIGAPNANFYTGSIEKAPNLPWKGIIPFANEVEKVFNIKCLITNDASASALGEMMYGKAQNMRDFLVITLGTGLGGGVVANGDLVLGKHGLAAELGHTLVNIHGRHCACGKVGCLETYASATGIRRTIYKLLADYTEPSLLRGVSYDELSTRFITEAAQKDDMIALEAFNYTGRILAMKLSDFVVHTDPEAIFLLGGLARAGHYLFEPIERYLQEYLMPIFREKNIKIEPSGLRDDDAPILGASSLVWKYLVN